VVGPIGASVVTGWAGPTAALAVVTVLAIPTQVAFAGLPQPAAARSRAAPPHRCAMHRRLTTGAAAALPALPALPALGAVGAVGVVFGSTQSALAARFAATSDTELTGLVYGCLGVGSALGGVAVTWLSPRIRLTTRLVGFGGSLAVTSLLLLPSSPPWLQARACLVIGANISPLLATAYVLAEHRAAPGTATTVMTLLAPATTAGVGIGAASAGKLLDAASPPAALTLPVLAGLIALTCGLGAVLSGKRT